jgi:hypothetical protein
VRIEDVEGVPVAGQNGLVWRPLRAALGIQAFGVNAYTAAEAGDQVVEEHDERSAGAGHHEELYVVVSGLARFTVGGETFDASSGTCVFLDDPDERRSAVAVEAGTTVLAIGGARGEAFRVSPWEFNFRAAAASTPSEARSILGKGLEEYPRNAALLYNLSCYEAMDGARDAALDHLAEAVAADRALAATAQSDSDLDAIRSDPRFPLP